MKLPDILINKEKHLSTATVLVRDGKAYAYNNGVPCFHRGEHALILRQHGVDAGWAFSFDDLDSLNI